MRIPGISILTSDRIQSQVLVRLLPILIPMLIIVGTTYMSSKSASLQSSQRFSRLIVQNTAAEANSFLERQKVKFDEWSSEDIYGLAIEFDTTSELVSQFQDELSRTTAFRMIVLTDAQNTVLTAVTSEGAISDLVGQSVLESDAIGDRSSIQLVEADMLIKLGDVYTKTYVFGYPCKGSSGDRNGTLLAYLDWRMIQSKVADGNRLLVENGYEDARMVVVETATGTAVAHSVPKSIGTQLAMDQNLKKDLGTTSLQKEFKTYKIDGQTDYVAARHIDDANTLNDDSLDASSSGLVLLGLVPEGNVLAQVRWMLMISLGISALGVILLVGLIWIVGGKIAKPIRRTAMMLKDIAQGEGDLTKRLAIERHDEIGEMSEWFNTFVKKIHDLIADVARTTREVASGATQIAATCHQMSVDIMEQSEQSTKVSTSVEEIASTVEKVAKNSSDAASKAQDAGKQASEGGKLVQSTVDGMKSIADIVNQSAHETNELGARSEQIGEIINVINDIADQTNLLALNAAIEAARAGEHGRGFAIVADEVRKLAERTTQATEEVAESIKAIQCQTGTAVQQMNNGIEQVHSGVSLAEDAGNSLMQIVESSSKVANMIESIAAASEQQSEAVKEIACNVDSINNVSRRAASGAKQSADAAAELSEKAEQLQTLVGQFKLDLG